MATRTLVFGDIHGCLSNFDALLQCIGPAADDDIVLLGDCVDRGPDSAGVLARILELSLTHHLTTIMGNHEQMMLAARASREKLGDWLQNGGAATLRSYAGATLRGIPAEHWRFLEEELVDYVETDSHILVHASVLPNLPMPEQPVYMLRWEPCDRLVAHESGKVVVCGHTPQKSAHPLNRGYAICIDTNACGGGRLTCLDIGSGRIWQADANGHVDRAHISDFPED